jgi:hypothetical protein
METDMTDKAQAIDDAIEAIGLSDWRITGTDIRVITYGDTVIYTVALEHGETGASLVGEGGSFGRAFADAGRRIAMLREDPDAS